MFREDLYYRINVLNLSIPPLRQRCEDIPLLVDFFFKKHGQRLNKAIEGISHAGMNVLLQYEWPGNVRQLENVVERLMVRTKERHIKTDLVNEMMQSLRGFAAEAERYIPIEVPIEPENELRIPLNASLAEIERIVIRIFSCIS